MPAQLVKNRISSNIWTEYFKFTVERNPWDKTLSHYHMINDMGGGNMSLDEYLAKGSSVLTSMRILIAKETLWWIKLSNMNHLSMI